MYSKALEYAVRGYSIMPLKKDKRPMLPSWKQYQEKAANDDQIEAWWEKTPDANIGIITGKISGITVIDVDAYKAGTTSIDAFPPTFTVKTGNGGYHLYYKYQPGLTISANAYPQFPGIDIRSDGGYIVAPPSVTSYDGKGGAYEVFKNVPIVAFPEKLFAAKKGAKKLSEVIGLKEGSRNDSITSVIGQLLHAAQVKDFTSEVWPAAQRINMTFTPPLPQGELKTTFDSIVKKELARRESMVLSPIQIEGGDEIILPIRKNAYGSAYKDMANALAVLEHHPYFKGTIRYNEFKQEIEYKGKTFQETDLGKMQLFMQREIGITSISQDVIHAAVSHYASENRYDEAQDWLKSLKWDKKSRLASWVHQSTSVEDNEYHSAIGAQWLMGLVKRIMEPGCTFDYMLVLVGPQGIGKTSFFRIIGGPWYKSYTGAIDNKDFYLALRGAMIVDLDEGAALYHAEAIKIKSIITETHDEYRAPYDRMMKKYPRRFVFSMSTNDTEPFRDITGNRRYWTIDAKKSIDFKWMQENRDQLFAEAYYAWKNKVPQPEVPLQEAIHRQAMHLPMDSWEDLVMTQLQKFPEYCEGSEEFSTTVHDIFRRMFPDESLARLGKAQEMRVANVFKTKAGLVKRRRVVDGDQKMCWMIDDDKIIELKAKAAKDTRDDFDMMP